MYFRAEYSPTVGLIRESPLTARQDFWLATDNRLASWALTQAGAADLALTLTTNLKSWGDCRHGLIEALLGYDVKVPPHVPLTMTVGTIGDSDVRLETRLSGAIMDDWMAYADLALYGALHYHVQGDAERAYQVYTDTVRTMFDRNEFGFQDKAYFDPGNQPPRYDTYKLAFALYAAKTIGVEVDDDMLQALLSKQDISGGFFAKYDARGVPQGKCCRMQ